MKDCSIIIPSHKRPKLLIRSLSYYLQFDYNLIIICELENDNTKLNKLIENNDDKITFIKAFNSSLTSKILLSRKYIKTKYCLISADDDFYDMKTVNEGINFLEKNNKYISYLGNFVQFKKRKYHTNLYKMYNYGESFNYGLEDFYSKNFKFVNSIYALHKSKVIQELLNFEKKNIFTKQSTLEFDFYLIPMFFGKIKVVDKLWMFRDQSRYTNYYYENDLGAKRNNVNSLYKTDNFFLESKIFDNYLINFAKLLKNLKVNCDHEILIKIIKLHFYDKKINKKQKIKEKISVLLPNQILEIYYYLKFKYYYSRFSNFYREIMGNRNFKKINRVI